MSAGPSSLRDEIPVLNPATLEPVGVVAATEPAGVAEAVAEARLAQERWAGEPFPVRRHLLRRAAHVLLESLDEVCRTVVAETGKPLVEAIATEVFVSLDALVWLARNAERVLRDEPVPMRQPYLLHKRGLLRYEPVGVVGILSPWNLPFAIPFTQAATAVAAGNAAIVKPSRLTPLSGALVEEVFRRAGAPAGLVRVVQGSGETVGEALLRCRGVGTIAFTGSAGTGRVVAARAAERLCPVVLELGGKDPMLVLADADLERAIEGALWGSFTNCGQVCAAIERIYVQSSLFEPFVEGLAARARALRLGRGDDPDVELGPLISEEQRTRVEDLVADAVAAGAEVAAGGARADVGLPGWFHEPTVLVGEPDRARLRREEIFGPVVTVVEIANEEDGIRRANDSPFGLGASVWTRDRAAAAHVASRLQAGLVWTNDVAYSYGACQVPWGGRGESGYGRTHGRDGLRAFCHVKFTDADPGRLTPPWWFPYDARVADGFRGALGLLYGAGPRARVRAAWRQRRGIVALGRKALRR